MLLFSYLLIILSHAAAAVTVCLEADTRMCLGVSGPLDSDVSDPTAIGETRLQIKSRLRAPPERVTWSFGAGTLCLPDDRCAKATTDTAPVLLVSEEGSKDWVIRNRRVKRTSDPTRCLTLMECRRKPSPLYDNRTYCDAGVSVPNSMTLAELIKAGDLLRGSYVNMAPCALNSASQRFVVRDSPTPAPSPAPSSFAPTSHAPTSTAPTAGTNQLASSSPTPAPTPNPGVWPWWWVVLLVLILVFTVTSVWWWRRSLTQ